MNRCRCNERPKTKTEGPKLMKIETRLRGTMFESVRGEYVI